MNRVRQTTTAATVRGDRFGEKHNIDSARCLITIQDAALLVHISAVVVYIGTMASIVLDRNGRMVNVEDLLKIRFGIAHIRLNYVGRHDEFILS